jgi:hypothetical protein
MKSLRFTEFGPPSVLRTEEVAIPEPGGGEALVQVKAAAINPSDIGNVAGHFKKAPLPRTPGRDFAGIAVRSTLHGEHYLDILYRKPGALAGSTPLEQKRQAGLWPPSFDRIWEALRERHGKQNGTRQMIDLLKLSQKHGQQKLQEAIESALSSNCSDSAAVEHLLNAEDRRHTQCGAIDVGVLERYARPLAVMHEYDQLLTTGAAR